MKKIIFTFGMGLVLFTASAQQKQGRVLYERTVQMRMHMMGGGAEQPMLPRSRTDQLEVLFGNNRSLRRAVADERPEAFAGEERGGMRVNIMVAGANDITYLDFSAGRMTEQRELGTKNYIVTDSIQKLQWKLTGETMTILNYPCQQAVARRIGKRNETTMENGELKTREIADTSQIVAWFTPAIPVPAGPEYQGQLPGMILGMDISDSRVVYRAVEITEAVDLSDIKAPSKGKKITAAEFAEEREKLMKEMQRKGGRGNTIRIGG
ncbi:GLPGLI family protein [Chitinophaga japonensis]|uniref:GLPGLI family protein n=1 Tax=Chitinophaga japonensis TaxID=104662 RepID=A0A562SZS5_CHIJA|nr:GLPGLI family protein [Chitinophaga japonensis]TWI86789.1 GLPGLI family protein [Chitinophaga japonensis]